MTDDVPSIEVRTVGARGGRVEIACLAGDQTVFRDRVDPGSVSSRKRFLKALREAVPAVGDDDAASVERSLLAVDVESRSTGNGAVLQGQPLRLREDPPADDAVDGRRLLNDIAQALRRFVVLPDGAPEATALWVVHTSLADVSDITPRLGIESPEKRCGKTRLLQVIGALVPRPLPLDNVSPAALYRIIEAACPTLLIDEADTFLTTRRGGRTEVDHELRGILNSGHLRGGTVLRCAGDDAEPRTFATFAPAAIALIGNLPPTLEDRAIVIRMRRRRSGERVERLRLARLGRELEPLRRRLRRWAEDHRQQLADADPEVPKELNDRAADNWRPLLAIADAVGGEWPELARTAAVELSANADADQDGLGVQLLRDVRGVFDTDTAVDRLRSEAIVDALNAQPERPWPSMRRGQGVSANTIANLLKPFGIRPRVVRLDGSTPRGYLRQDFVEAWDRYLGAETSAPEPQQCNTPCPTTTSDDSEPQHIRPPLHSATNATPCRSRAVAPLHLPQVAVKEHAR